MSNVQQQIIRAHEKSIWLKRARIKELENENERFRVALYATGRRLEELRRQVVGEENDAPSH